MAKIAVIGGTGLYDIDTISRKNEEVLDTPFGSPTAPIVTVDFNGTEVLFLARHGQNHEFLPHEVNYRANIFALKQLGASWVIAINAAGSMKENICPGDFVIPDQLIDFTKRRVQSFFGDGVAAYPSMADPYCPNARDAVIKALRNNQKLADSKLHESGSYICIEGPALSTRAESEIFRNWGASVIGMTNAPEAKLAREAEMGYASVCLITDYDCWKKDEQDVSAASVFEVMKTAGEKVKACLPDIFTELANTAVSDLAASALKDALVTNLNDLSEDRKNSLKPLIAKYLS